MIRGARPEDMPGIMEIERECFSVPWSETGMLTEVTGSDSLVLVSEEGGTVTGFAVLHLFGDEGELFNIAVRGSRRRRGVGDGLLGEILRLARKRGVRRVFLEVRKGNAAARALYKKHGFAVCGERRNYYDAPKEDAILMDAELPLP